MTQTYTQMDFQSVLTERIKYVARVNETKLLEQESKKRPRTPTTLRRLRSIGGRVYWWKAR